MPESFSKCPLYVPLVAVDSVRKLLLGLERGGSAAFADFKRRWEASELPALLYDAILRSSSRAAAAVPPIGTGGAAEAAAADADGWDKRLSVRQLYAAAASFLAGAWGGQGTEERAPQLVQVGAVFTLFCLYWGQPVHMREPIPLTPAGWKHLLHLCEIARLQKTAEGPSAQQLAGGSGATSGEKGGAGSCAGRRSEAEKPSVARLNLTDLRRAYAQLHGAGALTFCCAPAPLEDENFRRFHDVRDLGVWGNSVMFDIPSQMALWRKVIGESNAFLEQLQTKETALQTLDLSKLSTELQSYAGAWRVSNGTASPRTLDCLLHQVISHAVSDDFSYACDHARAHARAHTSLHCTTLHCTTLHYAIRYTATSLQKPRKSCDKKTSTSCRTTLTKTSTASCTRSLTLGHGRLHVLKRTRRNSEAGWQAMRLMKCCERQWTISTSRLLRRNEPKRWRRRPQELQRPLAAPKSRPRARQRDRREERE